MGHECLILLKIFTLLYLSKEVRKHKDTNDFRDAYCGERVQSSKLIARFTAHIDFTICVVSAITLVITVIFSIRVGFSALNHDNMRGNESVHKLDADLVGQYGRRPTTSDRR